MVRVYLVCPSPPTHPMCCFVSCARTHPGRDEKKRSDGRRSVASVLRSRSNTDRLIYHSIVGGRRGCGGLSGFAWVGGCVRILIHREEGQAGGGSTERTGDGRWA